MKKKSIKNYRWSSVEICAGGGGQAVGLELSGFEHLALIENDQMACSTLKENRPFWNVINQDLRDFSGASYRGVDLLSGGVPCPPFSIASKQLGKGDERDLFPEALRLAKEIQPNAIMLENVRGFASDKFSDYRNYIINFLQSLGYETGWRVINSFDFGVPQSRSRFILIALKKRFSPYFLWPSPEPTIETVGSLLFDLMKSNGWKGACDWRKRANGIAPTIVGGSKKHGGPDLGPTRAKKQWEKLGVDGKGIANIPPDSEFPIDGLPKLTNEMVALIQGFPKTWKFSGKKTSTYRQIGNALPPPVAMKLGIAIKHALSMKIEDTSKSPFRLNLDSQENLNLFDVAI